MGHRTIRDVEAARERSPAETAAACGVSHTAAELFLSSNVIDLHIESFSWSRVLGYDLRKRHGEGLHGALLVGQADLPRLLELGLRGGLFSLTANPWLSPVRNLSNLPALFGRLAHTLVQGDRVRFVTTAAEYRRARAENKLAAFLSLQGATLLGDQGFPRQALELPLVAVGLLHLTKTHLGLPSSPGLGRGTAKQGLSHQALELIEELSARRVFVDLAHLHPLGVRRALKEAPKDTPFIVTHTGIGGVYPHWRNLDDTMLRAVADRGGVVGIIYHSYYLGDPLLSGKLDTLVAHFVHAGKVIGRDKLALGSDWDGLICTPRDMKTCLELPRLAQKLLDHGFKELEVAGILGENFLRALEVLRGS